MSFDFISLLLAFIIILIFMAAFTMLRTISSPYLKRFEKILNTPMQRLKGYPDSYYYQFRIGNRIYDLFEVKYKRDERVNTADNNYIFLRVKIKGSFAVFFQDILSTTSSNNLLREILGDYFLVDAGKLKLLTLDDYYRDFLIKTDSVDKAKQFLYNSNVRQIYTELKPKPGSSRNLLFPLFVDPDYLIFDYRLSEKLVNELSFDPRRIKKHIAMLNLLADCVETI